MDISCRWINTRLTTIPIRSSFVNRFQLKCPRTNNRSSFDIVSEMTVSSFTDVPFLFATSSTPNTAFARSADRQRSPGTSTSTCSTVGDSHSRTPRENSASDHHPRSSASCSSIRSSSSIFHACHSSRRTFVLRT